MRKEPFVIQTAKGKIELTKGTYITLKNRKKQQTDINKTNKISKDEHRKKHLPTSDSISKRTRSSIRSEFFRARECQLRGMLQMDEDTTWSNINFAVYSLSLSLSAASFDHHFPR